MNLKGLSTILRFSVFTLSLLAPSVMRAQGFDIHLGSAFDPSHLLAYFIATMFIAILVMLFYNRLYVFREQDARKLLKNRNSRLGLVMQAGRLRLWVYYPETRHYRFISETGEYSREYNPIDLAHFYDRDDFEGLRTAIFDICENRRLTSTVQLRSAQRTNESQKIYEVHLSIAAKDYKGRITQLLGIEHDVTTEYEKNANTKQLLMRYHTVFNSSLIDMLYYNKDGVLTEINDKACQSFNIPDRTNLLAEEYRYKDNPLFNNIDLEGVNSLDTTAIIDFSKHQGDRFYSKTWGKTGKMYYEASINAIRDNEGQLKGVYIAGRNVTEMVESFHQQRAGAIALQKATKHIQEYIDNINYALRVSNVRLVNYYPQSYTLDISNIIGKSQIRLSQLRCIRLAIPRHRRLVSSALNRMDHLTRHNINQTIETEIRDEKKRQISLMFNLIPILNADKQVDRYFGMCRNMTDILETEKKLAIETQKAQEAELLKESFLTNMSYEIRTPLTTVLGYADLFETEHDEADEPIFVEEIKKNTNILLRLINDILFISKLDADMVEFKHEDFDFAEYFDAYCQMGWSSISPEVKTIIENPYEHMIINGDPEYMGKIVQMLCQISALFTHKGHVRAKYEYHRGDLVISVEDTGSGIDSEGLKNAFVRFARDGQQQICGTGLDLPIIKELAEKMGGTVEIQSELGKGTTVWLFFPCEVKNLEKKHEIIV